LDVGVFSVARGLNRFLQHLIHLSEIDVAEQWRNDSPNAKDNFEFERLLRFRQKSSAD
jgi:hypothetical protein